jgi:hypothetical protein
LRTGQLVEQLREANVGGGDEGLQVVVGHHRRPRMVRLLHSLV